VQYFRALLTGDVVGVVIFVLITLSSIAFQTWTVAKKSMNGAIQ
jgi:hypothetical protein